ncbi:MAG: hypothetical protein J2O46_08625, partial [Nocardioides sp.]|nr:hypothetical protein [Nocardioides sp.]
MSSCATGTRWVRASSMMAVGLAVVAGLGSMMSRDVLGLQFDPSVLVQSDSATFSSSQITANDVGFGMAPVRSGGKWHNTLRAGFASATVKGLCVSKTESLAGVKYLVRLQSTGGSFTANDTALDIASLRGVGLNLQGSTQI